MAVYRFSATIIKRSSGRSITAAAAYRSGEQIYDERTGLDHDYRRRSGVEHAEIMTPDNAPDWMKDRSKLWNAVEAGEKRKDAQLARHVELSLPHELKAEQRIKLVRDFVRDQFVAKGMVADIAVHAPDRQSDERNHHAHVLLSLRGVENGGFTAKKRREWNERQQLEEWREEWANYQNRALERAGSSERVDHRSYEAQGIDKEAEPKLGPVASEMEKKGKKSERGNERRKVRERNLKRDQLRREARAVDRAISREKLRGREGADRTEASAGTAERAEAERLHTEWLRQQEMKKARWKEGQKSRFGEWASRKRAELQSLQHDERGDLGRRHQRQKMHLEDRLKEYYGPGIREAKKTLAEIEARAKAGRVKRAVNRFTGKAKQDRIEAGAARASLADIETRMAEQRSRLENQQENEWQALETSLERQSLNLENRIKNAYERREQEGWKAQNRTANDHAREQADKTANDSSKQNGSRDRGGREFG